MATINDAPAHQRDLARQIPEAVRHQMGPEELNFRLEHASGLLRDASRTGLDPDLARYMIVQANRVIEAMPHSEYSAEQARLRALQGQALSQSDWDLHAAYTQHLTRLDEKHPQAPGIGDHLFREKEYVAPVADHKRDQLFAKQFQGHPERKARFDALIRQAADELIRMQKSRGLR